VVFINVSPAVGNANVWKSTNGGLVWSAPENALVGSIWSTFAFPGDLVTVGGAQGCSISTYGGASYSVVASNLGLNAASAYSCFPDADFANNTTLYAFDLTVGTGVYRINAFTGTQWENMLGPGGPWPAATAIFGGGQSSGALYAMTNSTAAALTGCARTLNPLGTPGTLELFWDTLNAPDLVLPPTAGLLPTATTYGLIGVAGNTVYAGEVVGGVPAVWAYGDYLAIATTLLTPAAGAVLPLDPATGWSAPFTFSWEPVGSSTGLVNNYIIAVWQKAGGITSATYYLAATAAGMALPNAPAIYSPNVLTFPGAAAILGGFAAPAGTEWEWTIVPWNEVGGDNVTGAMAAPSGFSIEAGVPQIEMTPPLEVPEVTVEVPVPADEVISPAWIWAVVIIGALLVIAVLILIWRTRRV